MELIQIIFSVVTLIMFLSFILLTISFLSLKLKEKSNLQNDFFHVDSKHKLQRIKIENERQNINSRISNRANDFENNNRIEVINNLNSLPKKRFEIINYKIHNN